MASSLVASPPAFTTVRGLPKEGTAAAVAQHTAGSVDAGSGTSKEKSAPTATASSTQPGTSESTAGTASSSSSSGEQSWTVCWSLLWSTTCGQAVFDNRDAIVMDGHAPLRSALERMSAYDFTALPVRNAAGAFEGMLTMGDVVVRMACARARAGAMAPDVHAALRDDSDEYSPPGDPVEVTSEVLSLPIDQVLGASLPAGRNLVVMQAEERLHQAMQALVQPRCHHVLVHGKHWWRILSQWDVLVVLSKACAAGQLGSISGAPIGEIPGLINRAPVQSLPWSVTARRAFRVLAAAGISAMPIVDSSGALCGTLSTSDLRGISTDTFKAMALPVMEFVRCSNVLQRPQAVATLTTSLGEVMRRMIAHEVHRLWIVDSDSHRHVIGVVSLTDLLVCFLHWSNGPAASYTRTMAMAPAHPHAPAMAAATTAPTLTSFPTGTAAGPATAAASSTTTTAPVTTTAVPTTSGTSTTAAAPGAHSAQPGAAAAAPTQATIAKPRKARAHAFSP